MAIIQISRIQHRRGRKLTDTGMPQLSSGELGWAIDTQELYIGNGAVSEGAPQVGNTKVLTEHDNIFDLADQYKYKETNSLWGNTTPTALTVQEKLDEFVSVTAFGARGDNTNQRVALQNALDSLYIRANSTKDVVNLYIPAGQYRLDQPLYIPPFARLIGDGIGKTIFYCDDTAFITCNGSSQVNNYVTSNSVGINEANTTQAREIMITGMSILPTSNRANSACVILNDTANTTLRQVYFEHQWQSGENELEQIGIKMIANNTTPAATCENVHIEECRFNGFNSAIWSITDVQNLNIKDCRFDLCRRGIDFADTENFILGNSAQTIGPSYCIFENNTFDLIDREGILVGYGKNNSSLSNTFLNVGNNGADYTIPITACINFSENAENISDNDFFERFGVASDDITNAQRKVYVPEVIGASYNCNFMNIIGMPESAGEKEFLKLPAIENGKVIIDFALRDYHDATTGNIDYITISGTIEAVIVNSIANSSAVINLSSDYMLDDHNASYTSGDFELRGQIRPPSEYSVTDASIDLSQPIVKAEHNIAFSENVQFRYTMQVIQS